MMAPSTFYKLPVAYLCISLSLFKVWGDTSFITAMVPPVIGILTTPNVFSTKNISDHQEVYFYIASSYVKWLEASGAKSMAIPYYATDEELSQIFNQVNGILFPGGSDYVDMPDSSAPKLYKMAKEANDKGDYMPIWGTCLGYEYLVMLTSSDDPTEQEESLQSDFDSWNMSLPLNFTTDAVHSTMYKSRYIRNMTQTLPLTMNNHHYGFDPEKFKSHDRLSSFFRVLSTNVDRQGRSFISSVEAIHYPFYGVQFHPEKNMFEYATYPESTQPFEDINHSQEGIEFSHYMGKLFVNEARKNMHKFVDTIKYPNIWSYESRLNVDGFEQILIIAKDTRVRPEKKHRGYVVWPAVLLLSITGSIILALILRAIMVCMSENEHIVDSQSETLDTPLLIDDSEEDEEEEQEEEQDDEEARFKDPAQD